MTFPHWDIDTLARTVYGEARGGGYEAMADVACVILKRHAHGWAHTISGVCRANAQFSCWNRNDPNYRKILMVEQSDPAFKIAMAVASDASLGRLVDHTGGADSYFATASGLPYWAIAPAVHTVDLWEHSFWIVRPAPRQPPAPAEPPLTEPIVS